MTDVQFRFRKGAGSNLDVLFGTVTLKPTLAHSRGTSMVLPAPSTWDIINGEVLATNVQPTPEPVGGVLEWGYEVTVKDRHGKSYSFLVGVPDSTTAVEFVSLPRYFETKPPLFGQGPKGDAGEAATISVGTVTSGDEASVTNGGTNQAAILNFVLPKGDKGTTGTGIVEDNSKTFASLASSYPTGSTLTYGSDTSDWPQKPVSVITTRVEGGKANQTIYSSSGTVSYRVEQSDGSWATLKTLANNSLATSTSDGLMPKADKKKLDSATVYKDANTIPMRNAAGNIEVGDVTNQNQATSKNYVDNKFSQATDYTLEKLGTNASRVIYTRYKPKTSSIAEHYLTVLRNGDKVPNSVRRVVASDNTTPTPPRETIDSFYNRTGASTIINASGWWSDGRFMGLSILNGDLVQGWEPTGDLGNESCVIMRSGELKIYTKDSTPDPQQIIQDGGYQAFSWGAAAYINGQVTTFRTKYTRYNRVSGRQCVGSTTDGHIFILSFPGITDVSGATGDDIVLAAQSSGLNVKNLYILDSGGSVQTKVNGKSLVQSSDGAPRPIPDALYFYGAVSNLEGRGPTYRIIRSSVENPIPNAIYTRLVGMIPAPGDNPDSSITLNDSVYTVQESGLYEIAGQVLFPHNTSGLRIAAIVINRNTNTRYRSLGTVNTTSSMTVAVNIALNLSAGDTVELQAYQNSGGVLTSPQDPDGNRLTIYRVRG